MCVNDMLKEDAAPNTIKGDKSHIHAVYRLFILLQTPKTG